MKTIWVGLDDNVCYSTPLMKSEASVAVVGNPVPVTVAVWRRYYVVASAAVTTDVISA